MKGKMVAGKTTLKAFIKMNILRDKDAAGRQDCRPHCQLILKERKGGQYK